LAGRTKNAIICMSMSLRLYFNANNFSSNME
jgi:hypothetical protein